MSAEHEGPARGRKEGGKKPAAKPPRVGSSLTDAVVAALAKVDDKKDKKDAAATPPASPGPGGSAAAPQIAKEPPAVVGAAAPPPAQVPSQGTNGGANGFRAGPGSFADLARSWAGAPRMAPVHVAAPAAVPAPAAAAPVAAPRAAAVAPAPVVAAPASVVAAPAPAAAAPVAAASRPEPVAASAPVAAPIRESAPPVREAAQAVVPAVGTGPVRVRYYGRTDVGLVREHNEDNFLVADLAAAKRGVDAPREIVVDADGCVFAVCDGMGGAAAGEVASQMAVDTIYEVFSQGERAKDRDVFARRLVRSVEEAGHRIFSAAKMDRTRRGMGTTTTLAGLVDNVLFVGQVGDSRAYILRGEQLELITKDQSLVNQLIEAGQLTPEEAEAFEHSNIILQALGTTEDVTVDLTFLDLRRGDRLLMCSDGLSGLVSTEAIREVMRSTPDLAETASRLIQMANSGGGHDNITVILAEFDGDGLAAADGVRVLYQQYPLPADDTARGHVLAPRDTQMKAGGPKPGADVKRDELAGVRPAQPSPSGGKTGLIAVVVIVLIALLAGGWFVLRPGEEGADPPSMDRTPITRPQPPVLPVEPDVVDPPPDLPPELPAPVVAHGTIVVETDVENGTLWVNGHEHGPLVDGMTIDLPPAPYALEARSGDAQIAEARVQLAADARAPVQLNRPVVPDEPPPVAPAPVETPRPRPVLERPRPRPITPTQPPIRPITRPSSGDPPPNPFGP